MALVSVDEREQPTGGHVQSWLAWSEDRQPLDMVLRSSYEPGELLQWLGDDDSSITVDPVSYTHLTLPTIYSV